MTTTVDTVLQGMSIPGMPRVYVLGALERRVTVYSQQVRALNLVHALIERGDIGPGSQIAVVGAGAAGLTCAAGALQRGVRVTLLEKRHQVLPIFQLAPADQPLNRWLHPRVYDWPQPGWDEGRARLPLLDWQAGSVAEVATELLDDWSRIAAEHGDALTVHCHADRIRLAKLQPESVELTWTVRPATGDVQSKRGHFDAVVLAVGFGLEEYPGERERSYWEPDDIDSRAGYREADRPRTWLVSGCGDGGLTDLLRVRLKDLQHADMVADFASAQSRALEAQIRAIENDPRARGDGAAKFLTDAYEQLLTGSPLVTAMKARLRDDTEAVLNSPDGDYLRPEASALNRFLVCQLYLAGGFELEPGRIRSVTEEDRGVRVTLENGREETYDRIVRRHGPEPALLQAFPQVWQKLESLRDTWRTRPQLLDQTREPIWPEGAFGPARAVATKDVATSEPDSEPAARVSSPAAPPAAPTATPAPVFSVPYPADLEHLVGRAHLVQHTRDLLTSGQPASIGHAASFQGLGGLGKTRLAVEYAHAYREHYPDGVLWLEADANLDAQLIRIAKLAGWIPPGLEPREEPAIARHQLRKRERCLIIFDNVEDQAAIQELLPAPTSATHVLLTSRLEQPGFAAVALVRLTTEESLSQLQQTAGRTPTGVDDVRAARAIVERLDGLPLAIELAGAYLRHRRTLGWAEYLALLQRDLGRAMPARFGAASVTRHEADVRAALRVSEEVFAEEPELRSILDLLTWSGPASMSASLMAVLLDMPDAGVLAPARAFGVALRLLIEEPPSTPGGESRVRIHRLVREVRRHDTDVDQLWPGDAQRALCERLGDWFEARRDDFLQLQALEVGLEHLREWLQRLPVERVHERTRLTWLQAYPPFQRGLYTEARDVVARALEMYRAGAGDSPLLEAHLRNDLGSVLYRLGAYDKALSYHEQALEIRQRVLGEDHPETAQSLGNVGSSHGELGQHETALEYSKQALEILRRVLGEDHPHTATSLNNVGSSHGELGQHETALEYSKQALEIRRRVLGEDHPDTAASLNNVGGSHGELGQHETALEYSKQALEIQRRVLGEDHPETARSLNNIGESYQALGQLDKALAFEKRALDIRQRLLGEEHPDTALSLHHVGCRFLNLGQYREALSHFRQGLHIWRQTLGDAHPHSTIGLHQVVLSLHALGRDREAHQLVQDHLRRLPADHESRAELEDIRDKLTPPGFRPGGRSQSSGTGKSKRKRKRKRKPKRK